VAVAWILFEKLVYKKKVNEKNKWMRAAMCLSISFKQYELFGIEKEEEFKRVFVNEIQKFSKKTF